MIPVPAVRAAEPRPGSEASPAPVVTVRSALQELARAGLLQAAQEAATAPAAEGMPGTDANGRLIRPLVALAAAADPLDPPAGFWSGALAIQLAHEASLVHDDIVDGAAKRRGESSEVAEGGVAYALLRGDHLLTASYRAAAATGSLEFVTLFARAVERTVAGEAAQGRAVGRALSHDEYRRIALGKAGELLGCALALAPLLEGRRDAADLFELGRRVGLLYQMLDDMLDYCPAAGTGKPSLGDYRQRRWTWVLEECPGVDFDSTPERVVERLLADRPSGSPMRRVLARLETEAGLLREAIAMRLPEEQVVGTLIADWVETARVAVQREEEALRTRCVASILRDRLPGLAGADGYLARHSRSFRFASRFFPADDAERVARVYTFCRMTDDLVDLPSEAKPPALLLDEWLELSRRAYHGEASGLPLLDRVMAEMTAAGVPFGYAAELVEGMRMDLRGERYANLHELNRYTYRVASVVGLWLTRLFGVHEPAVLARAERLGHAMQLTNILRDVGEDWRNGRLYLPAETMRRHGVSEDDLDAMVNGTPITPAYGRLVEELMVLAEEDYAAAVAAIPMLPTTLGRPVAVAAQVYRGIHREIRRNGYDNLRRRAYTSSMRKGLLAASGLWRLERARRRASEPAMATSAGWAGGSVE